MKPFLGAKSTIRVGAETIIESNTPDDLYGVVFEDDGSTGYFYARDYSCDELFVDALHIYDVNSISDKDLPSEVKIIWSPNFAAAALLINQRPNAVFDFNERRGYAYDPFPEPQANSNWQHEEFHSELIKLFHGN